MIEMPRSVIKHRPIYQTAQIEPLVHRASYSVAVTTDVATASPGLRWPLPFVAGMVITLAILVIIHFIM